MTENFKKVRKIINSELASKVLNSIIENEELLLKLMKSI